MAIKAKIQLDNSELKAGLKQAESQASKTGKTLGKNLGKGAGKGLEELGKGADDAVRALDSIAGAAGGASTGLSGLAGDIISLVKNPMAALIAVIGLIISIGSKIWDSLTLNADEAAAKTAAWVEHTKELVQEVKKQKQELDDLIDLFIQLNNTVPQTIQEFVAQVSILATLEQKYGDLGVQVNFVKQEFEGLVEALIKLQKIQAQKQQDAYKDKVNALERKAQQEHTRFYQDNDAVKHNPAVDNRPKTEEIITPKRR